MKKTIVFALILLFGLMGTAHADPLAMFGKIPYMTAYIGLTDTGNTTYASGASTMYLDAPNDDNITRADGTQYFNANEYGPWYGVQLMDLDSSQAQQGLGGTISKDFDFYAECSLDPDTWTYAERFYFYKDETVTATTNNTAGPKWARLPANTYVRFGFVTASGTTVFDHAEFRIFPGKEGDFYESSPLLIDQDYSAFATTGVTQFWSGTTAIEVAAGARAIEVQTIGDDINYTTDGSTTPSTTTSILEDGKIIILKPYEWERFWYDPAGNSAGGLSIKQWTADPTQVP